MRLIWFEVKYEASSYVYVNNLTKYDETYHDNVMAHFQAYWGGVYADRGIFSYAKIKTYDLPVEQKNLREYPMKASFPMLVEREGKIELYGEKYIGDPAAARRDGLWNIKADTFTEDGLRHTHCYTCYPEHKFGGYDLERVLPVSYRGGSRRLYGNSFEEILEQLDKLK